MSGKGQVVASSVLLFLIGFAAGVYFLFPFELLATSIHAEIEGRLPDFVHLQEFRYDFPATFHLTPFVHIHPLRIAVPLQARPALKSGGVVVNFFDPPRQNFSGRYVHSTGKINLNVRGYPVDRLLPDQSGTIEGKLRLGVKDIPEGEFQFTVSMGSLRPSQLVPAFLEGRRIGRVRVMGTVKNSTITVQSFSVQSSGLKASGTGELRLSEPINNSRLRVDVNITSPVKRRIRQTMTIEAFRRLVSG